MVRTANVVAWSLLTLTFALTIPCIALIILNRETSVTRYLGTPPAQIVVALTAVVIAVVGLAVARRHPKNAIGWIFLAFGAEFAFGGFATQYAAYGILTAPGSLAATDFMLWAGASFVQAFGPPFLVFIYLLFPSGRPASPRWKPVVVSTAFFMVAYAVGYSFRPGPLESPWNFRLNPYALGGSLGDAMTWSVPLGRLIGGGVLALSALRLIRELRRARGVQRQQLRLFAYAGLLEVAYLPFYFAWISFGADVDSLRFLAIPISLLGTVLFANIPVSAGIAILRYRLYDIDHLINRTLVYGATSGVIAAVFFGGILALQSLLRPLTSGSELAVAASTLGAFALFQPIRRRLQSELDRRFDRSRYDAARTLDAFSDELRDEVDLTRVQADLLGAVAATVAPEHVSLWLRRGVPGMGSNPVTISGRSVVRKELA